MCCLEVFLPGFEGLAQGAALGLEDEVDDHGRAAMQRGDADFRLLVDRTLSRLYRSGAIAKVFNNAFGTAEPSEILKAMYLVNSLPE